MTQRPAPIVLLTDFGPDSWYVGAVKGAVLAQAPGVALVDLHHGIAPQDVAAAAFLLCACYRDYPPGSIFLAVVDPGVGGPRRALAGRLGERCVVAPDNGLASEVLRREGPGELRVQDNPALRRGTVSATFHGRDVFAPAAAFLAMGGELATCGPPCGDPVLLPAAGPRRDGETLIGRVMLADSFGNYITDIHADDVAALADAEGAWSALEIVAAGLVLHGLARTYCERESGQPMALIGSLGFLELAVAGGSAQRLLAVEPGDRVYLRMSRESLH
jgi:hypothetical protein